MVASHMSSMLKTSNTKKGKGSTMNGQRTTVNKVKGRLRWTRHVTSEVRHVISLSNHDHVLSGLQ